MPGSTYINANYVDVSRPRCFSSPNLLFLFIHCTLYVNARDGKQNYTKTLVGLLTPAVFQSWFIDSLAFPLASGLLLISSSLIGLIQPNFDCIMLEVGKRERVDFSRIQQRMP